MWILLLQQALPQFSHMGYVAVALLGLTGVINTALLVGSVNGLVGLPYGRLLLVKICMFLVLVAVAIRNRMILSPQTKRARTASAGIAG